MSSIIFYLLNTNTALCARHFTTTNSFNFDNDPMSPFHRSGNLVSENKLPARDHRASMWVLVNLTSVPKLTL